MRRKRRFGLPPEARAVESGLQSYSVKALTELTDELAGSVMQAGADGYNDARMGFMHSYQQFPQLIIKCLCESDVVAALKFARATGLKVVARSGGHSTAGYSVNDQITLDMSRMAHVRIDRDARRAWVGAGTPFRTLNRMLHAAGLHLPGGGCETVCVAGYMQGGGYGFTSRLYGMNCDNVLSIRVVTAEGQVIHAHAGNHADLYWAMRGGTGNQFGVLTEIEYRLVEEPPLFGFGLRFPLTDRDGIATAARVLADLQAQYTKDGPANIGLQALLMNLPTAAAPNGQIPGLMIRGLCAGTEAEARAALGPLMAHVRDPETQIEIWRRGRYLHLNEILLQTAHPPGQDMPNVSMNTKPLVDGRIIADLHGPDRWADLLHHFLAAPDKTSFVAMELYGGAVNEPAPDANAFVHRDASLNLFAWSFWTFDTHEEASTRWLDRFGEIAGAMGNGARYQNYPRRGNAGFRAQYFGSNLPRLMQIKRHYDPHDRFSYEQGLLHGEPR